MEEKVYSLQSPEYLAKEYGGNKQKLAQAAQMGLVDPTAAVMAGMFIDRMRAGALQEQAPPQQTVAQQVFTPPQPATPPVPMPQGAMGGAPSGPPQGGMGGPVPQGPPQQATAPTGVPGMASGGLTDLAVPDNLFDGSDAYASGGLVSFSDGGSVDDEEFDYWEYGINAGPPRLAPGTSQYEKAQRVARGWESRVLDLGAERPEAAPRRTETVAGAGTPAAAYRSPLSHMREWLGDRAEQRERRYEEYAKRDADRRRASAPGPRTVPKRTGGGGATPVERPPAVPTPSGDGRVRGSASTTARDGAAAPTGLAPPAPTGLAALAAAKDAGATPERKTLEATLADVERMQGDPTKGEAYKAQQAALQGVLSEEGKKARKKEDLWTSLAEIGFNIAAGQSPNALSNISAGAAAALPGINSRNKERRTEQREALKDAMNMELSAYGLRVNSVKTAAELFNAQNELIEKGLDRQQALEIATQQIAAQREGNILQYRASIASVAASRENSIRSASESRLALSAAQAGKLWDDASKRVETALSPGGSLSRAYNKLPVEQRYAYKQKLVQAEYNAALSGGAGSDLVGFSARPTGR